MDWIDLLQWPGMAASLLAAWLVASLRPGRRLFGFWVFLGSNLLWIVWGVYTHAWALVALQFGLAALNIRGVRKNDRATAEPGGSAEAAPARIGRG